jgi:hypothetical protein
MKELITENLNTVIAIVGVLIASFGVISASFKKAKKEILDVPKMIREAKANDGKIDEKEALAIADEVDEAIKATMKFWYLIVGIFKKSKKKTK